ncbi:universal stress protein, partial [Kineococcus glutinatus]|uniref:universal stress protein n=1 Tax=Kineococcus glutinatus TaxID=1070872 RepID=UPI0031EF7030
EALRRAEGAALEARPDLRVQVELRFGAVVPALREALAGGRLLALGSRGLGEEWAWFLGTSSGELAATAPCPVLLAGRWAQPAPRPEGPRVVVAALGGTGTDEAVLAAASAWALRGDAQLHVLHSRPQRSGRPFLVDVPHPRAGLVTTVSRKPPVEAVLTAAAEADLLVMGTSGRAALTGLAPEPVAVPVLASAPCPVLVVPPAAAGACAR